MTQWLDVIGIGEDGVDGLRAPARVALAEAEIVIGGDRHHALLPDLPARRIAWPTPFRAMLKEVTAMRGQRVAVLVTGDPLWFSAGRYFTEMFPPDEVAFHPQLSAFQLAAIRMGWSLADVETLTIHGRPAAQIIPYFADKARLLVLTQDAKSPDTVAALLTARGFGPSQMTVLGALGGADETRTDGLAQNWSGDSPAFHVLAVECLADPDADLLPCWGLPDAAFQHDGKMTKREVRTITLAALAPRRGQMLWDIGTGCGSVAIEWMRAGRDANAVGIDSDPGRLAMARANAEILGTPRLKLIEGRAPEALADLPTPDAVFIGGGLSEAVVDQALAALPRHGRLVANAVTLESETLLAALHARHGGSLTRLSVARADCVGSLRGWRPAMPVTQWAIAT